MIETKRLLLIPLDERQLELLYNGLPRLELELGCDYRAEPLEEPFLSVVKQQMETMKRDFDNYLWHTFWLLKDKRSKIIVGAAVFKGAPDKNGAVEIGYGIGDGYRKMGYMAEAVNCMCEWALRQPGVNEITAETNMWNVDSHQVLVKCGFEKYKTDDNTCWWRKRR